MTAASSVNPVWRAVKLVLHALCVILASPFIVMTWLEGLLTRSEVVFVFCAQTLSLLPGLPGVFMRAAYYWATLRGTSWQTHVGFGSVIMHRGAVLHAHASMGAYCVIGHADIGERVMMGSRVSIPSGRRQHLDDAGRLSHEEMRFDTVRIGSGSWIGEGAIIMADVGTHCIVSSGAVVAQNIPDRVLVGGNPARVIKELSVAG